MKITQKQLIEELNKYSDAYHKYEYEDFLTIFTEVIEKLVKEKHEVTLNNFGTFMPSINKSFMNYNLKEGIMKETPESVTMRLKVSQSLQNRIKAFNKENKNESTDN